MSKVMIEGMEMPKSCIECRFCMPETETIGKCRALPIRDLDGKFVACQRVYVHPETALGKERSKHCPLREVKECK